MNEPEVPSIETATTPEVTPSNVVENEPLNISQATPPSLMNVKTNTNKLLIPVYILIALLLVGGGYYFYRTGIVSQQVAGPSGQNTSSSNTVTIATPTSSTASTTYQFETYQHPLLKEKTFAYPSGGELTSTNTITESSGGEDIITITYPEYSLKVRILDGIGGLSRLPEQPYQIISGDYSKGIGRIIDTTDSQTTKVMYFNFYDGSQQFMEMLNGVGYAFSVPADKLTQYQPLFDAAAAQTMDMNLLAQPIWGKATLTFSDTHIVLSGITETGSTYEIQSTPNSAEETPLHVTISPTGKYMAIMYQKNNDATYKLGFYDFTSKTMLFMGGVSESFGEWVSDHQYRFPDAETGLDKTLDLTAQ